MSVVIDGMDMPKTCNDCLIQCGNSFLYAGVKTKRHPNCKLREYPDAHWIINPDGYYPYCSNCKQEPVSRTMTDFCPNCGAPMKGGARA